MSAFKKKGGIVIPRFSNEPVIDSKPLFTSDANLLACRSELEDSEFAPGKCHTFVEATLKCSIMHNNTIYIKRRLSRIWFNGSEAHSTYFSFIYKTLDVRWLIKAFKGFPEWMPGYGKS